MKPVIVRKVPYRIPQTKRLVWALILAERGGLSLLFVRSPNADQSHALVIATENVSERVFENVNVSHFPLEEQDLPTIGCKFHAVSDAISENAFNQLFAPDDLE